MRFLRNLFKRFRKEKPEPPFTFGDFLDGNLATLIVMVNQEGQIQFVADYEEPELFTEMLYCISTGKLTVNIFQDMLIHSSEEDRLAIQEMIQLYEEFTQKELDEEEPIIDPEKVF